MALYVSGKDDHAMLVTEVGRLIIRCCPHLREDTNEGSPADGRTFRFGGVEEVPLDTYERRLAKGVPFGSWRFVKFVRIVK